MSFSSVLCDQIENWQPVIEAIMDKMYAEASNPVIPRFLSHISDQLADMPNLVFPTILRRLTDQPT